MWTFSVRASMLLAVLSLAACGPSTAGGGGSHPDLGTIAPSPDLSVIDSGVPLSDLAAPPDLLPPADLTPPAQTGLTWPVGQTFPTFAPFDTLDLVDLGPLTADQQTLFVTLAGLINRQKPRIYTLNNGDGEGKTFWLDLMKTTNTTVANPYTLITKYASEVKGIIVYDDTQTDTINLATTIAGQTNAIVASPAQATQLTGAPYNLTILVDLRTNKFTNRLDIYQYELNLYSAGATHRLICGLNPAIAGNLRDYAVATSSMMVWLDPRIAAEQALLLKFLALLPANSAYLGWWVDEPTGVHAASTVGVPTFAADWASNLTVMGGTPRGSATVVAPPAPPPLENKVYVGMFMSDGDNVQEDQHLIPLKWNDSNRGKVPVGWTIDPALVDVAPNVLRYFQSTATSNDVLVSGPSGLGYTYPAAWVASDFDNYSKISGRYMQSAGLRVVTVWNNGVDLSAANMTSYASNIPGLLGLTIQDESMNMQIINGTLPLKRLDISYGDTAAIIEANAGGIDSQLPSFTGAAPLFVAVQGNMNSGSMNPTAFNDIATHYGNNSNVVFVRPDHFFQLLRQANQPPAHRVFTGDYNGDGKTDTMFYYGGDGNWWMAPSDGTSFTWHLAGNVTSLGNFVDGKHQFYGGDYNGDGKSDMLVYGSNDGNWRLGTSDGTNLTWSTVSNTGNFGNLMDGGHRIFTGDFTGDGKSDVLFYYSGDGHWWLGTSSGTALTWTLAAGTTFGNLLDGTHAIYTGDYNGDGKLDLLVYNNSDGTFWFGISSGTAITWTQAAATSGYGNLLGQGHRILTGDFNGDGKSDVLFYYNGDSSWWMGVSNGTALTWHQAGNSAAAGNLVDWSYRMFSGDYDGDGKSDVAYYNSVDGSFWLGLSDGNQLAWKSGGTGAAMIGDLADPERLLFGGDYDGDGKADALSYSSGDGNWRVGLSSGSAMTWHVAGSSSGFGNLAH
jgi:hypothetical protein